ncbi:hypothetical protein ABBQ38_004190 [Trebouxia sp. C0009 RCD-2024]
MQHAYKKKHAYKWLAINQSAFPCMQVSLHCSSGRFAYAHSVPNVYGCIHLSALVNDRPPSLLYCHPATVYTWSQVVSETYEELVFHEPAEGFYQRVANHMPMLAPPMSQAQWFTAFDQQDDLRKLTAARQRVAGMTASVQRQLEAA